MPKSRMNCRSPQPFSAKYSCMYFTPWPTIRPKPSPRAIWWSISTCDAPLPHDRSMPPVRSAFRMPRCQHSIANAQHVPNEMVSMP